MNDPLPHDVGRGTSRRALGTVAGLLLLLAMPTAVAADAKLISSIPAEGAVLTTVPDEAVLAFDEAITGNSSFDILDTAGGTVASGAHDANNPTTIRGSLPNLSPGTYTVQWAAQSADGHVPRGTFMFTVAEPTPPPPTGTPEPTTDVTDAPTIPPTEATSPSPTPSPSDSDGSASATDALVPIVVVGLLVAGGLMWFLRHRGPS